MIRDAVAADLPAIVALLGDDMLGSRPRGGTRRSGLRAGAGARSRPTPTTASWWRSADGAIVGCFQLDFLPGPRARGAGGRRSNRCGCAQPARPGDRRRDDALGDRRGARARLRAGPAHHRQARGDAAPLLSAARLRGVARGHEAGPARSAGAASGSADAPAADHSL